MYYELFTQEDEAVDKSKLTKIAPSKKRLVDNVEAVFHDEKFLAILRIASYTLLIITTFFIGFGVINKALHATIIKRYFDDSKEGEAKFKRRLTMFERLCTTLLIIIWVLFLVSDVMKLKIGSFDDDSPVLENGKKKEK